MKSSKTAPQWAVNLVIEVCADYKRALPDILTWSNKDWAKTGGTTYRRRVSWGRTYPSRINIRAGIDEADQELVLLHELAHHIVNRTKKGRREGHSSRFWKLAFELYEKYGVSLDYAWEREKDYKIKAAVGYQAVLAKK